MFDLIEHLKQALPDFDQLVLTGGLELGGDERVDWDSLMSSVGGVGTLTPQRE